MVNWIAEQLKQKGYSDAAIAGILGNIAVETGGSYDYQQQQYGGGPGRGLFQMEGGMLDAYRKYLEQNKLPDGARTQIDFVDMLLKSGEQYDIGAGHRQKIANAFSQGNPELATAEFSDRFLRPNPKKAHMQKRMKSANAWWEQK